MTDSSSPMACVETASQCASGVLATTMPRSVAAATGTLSVPLPVRMMATQRGRSARLSGVIR